MSAPHGVICTASGVMFSLEAPDPRDIRIDDIAHHLARLCRFTGACSEHYSVAQHSVLVARHVHEMTGSADAAMYGLLHDAEEAYVGDLSAPGKAVLPEWRALAEPVREAVRRWAGLDPESPWWDAVHTADLRMLATERRDLMPAAAWWVMDGALEHEIIPWRASVAQDAFLSAWRLFSLTRAAA